MKTNQIIVVIAALLGSVHAAHAQGDAAQAEQLFRDAKKLFDEGKLSEACAAWEASERMDPSLGTLTNIANCREKNGDLATAWEAYVALERRTAGIGKYQSLNDLGRKKATELEPRLSYLTINVPDEVRVEGLEVFRGGKLVDPGAWNRALPIDGGEHTITGRAPGHEAWSTSVTVEREGDKKAVEVPRFKAIQTLVEPPPGGGGAAAAAAGGTPGRPIDEGPAPSSFTGKRKLALGLAGAGVVAIGAGVALGVSAKGLEDDAFALCPMEGTPCADAAEAQALADRGATRAMIANVAFGVGGVAVVGAAVLWFTGKPAQRDRLAVTPQLGARSAAVTVQLRF
jgi:hypothetical protein